MTKKITIPQQNQPFRRQSSLGGNVSFRNLGGTDNNNYVVMAVVTKVYYKQGRVDFRLTNSTNHVVTETGDGMGSAPIPVDFYGYQRDGKIFGHYRPIQIGDLIAVAYLWGHKQAPIVLGVYPKDSSSYEFVAPQEASSFGDDKDEATYDYALGDQKIFPDGSLEYHSGNGKYFKTLRGKSFMLLDDSPLYEHLWVGYNDIGAFKDSDQNTINPLQEEAGDWLLVHEDNNEGSNSTDHRTRFYVNKDGTFQVVLSKSSKLDNLVILEGSKSNGFTLQQLYNVPQKGWISEKDPHKEPDIKNAQQYVKFNIGGSDRSATIEAATKDDSVEQATKLEIKDDGIYVNDKPLISSNPKYAGKTIIDDTISNSDGLNDAIKKAQDAAKNAAEQAKQAGEVAKAAGAAAEAAGTNALNIGDDIKKRIIYYASISKEKDIAIPGKYIIINTDTYIKNGTIKNAYIEDGAIDHAKIANEAVWSSQIANLAVTRAKIADAAIGSAQIEDLAVTDEKVGKLTFDHMVGATLDAGQINVINLNAKSIKAGTITADKLKIGELGDITDKLGTIADGKIIVKGNGSNSGVSLEGLDADNPDVYTPSKKAALANIVHAIKSSAEASLDYAKQVGLSNDPVAIDLQKKYDAMVDGLAKLFQDMTATTNFNHNTVEQLTSDCNNAIDKFQNLANSQLNRKIGQTADNKNSVYQGYEQPANPHINDIWFQENSDGTYQIRVYDGGSWISPGMQDIKEVQESVSTLPRSYYSSTQPAGTDYKDGDIWYKTSTDTTNNTVVYTAYKWNRNTNTWDPLLDATSSHNYIGSAPANPIDGDFWMDNTTLKQYQNGVWKTIPTQGPQGVPGVSAKQQYIHIAYATSANGTENFSNSTFSGATYIGLLVDFNEEDSKDHTKYTWSRLRGADGTDGKDGVPGKPGVDGKTSYVHFAYANSSDGKTDFNLVYFNGAKYIGIYSDFTEEDSKDHTKYTWSEFRGQDGQDGTNGKDGVPGTNGKDGETSYIHTAYANSSDGKTNFNLKYFANALYIGMYTDFTEADSDDYTKYTWSRLKGNDGTDGKDGVPGAKGADGKTSYVHFAYANSSDGKTDFNLKYFANALYIGTYTDFNESDSSEPTKYTWSRLKGDKGDKGDQGIQGPKGDKGVQGPTGKSSYTHIAYSNSSDGTTDFTVSDSNRTYIGMYVDFNEEDSSDHTKYAWSLIKGKDGADGKDGVPGKPGVDGKTPYLHIAYADSSDGKTNFSTDTPGTHKYIGSYTDFTQADSSDPALYSWQLVQGPKGDKGDQGLRGLQGPKGDKGVQGPTGADGRTSYTHIAYADTATGSGFSQYPDNKKYIGIYVDFNVDDSNDVTKYNWSLIKGADGKDGVPGKPGVDGKTSYFHIAYANSADGNTNFNLEYFANALYIGTYTDFNEEDSKDHTKYTWSRLKGDPGANGKDGVAGKDGVGLKRTEVTYGLSGSDSTQPSRWSSQVPDLVKGQYLWTKTVWIYTDDTSETGYQKTYIAKDGNDGTDGVAGKDGVGISSTTITYAVGTSGTTAPTSGWNSQVPNVPTGQYLWTKTIWSYTDNTNETGYSVAKMGETGPKGDPGKDGVPGAKGADGKTYYTWIKYATDSSGSNISDSPIGMSYIGIAPNKESPNESNVRTDYRWAKIKGDDGIPGAPGADGKTPYVHIAYANSADGKKDFTTDGTIASKATINNNPYQYTGTYVDYNQTSSQDHTMYTWTMIYDKSKKRNFTDQPTTPYNVGDTWTDRGATYFCTRDRLTGAFDDNDWRMQQLTIHSLAPSVTNSLYNDNLVSGTDQAYTMGYGIPNTTWQNGYAYEKLPTNVTGNEILPQDPHTFFYNMTQGTTYTQTIWLETDATVKDLSVAQITWFTSVGHDPQPATLINLGENKYKLYSTYMWPGKSNNNVRLFDIFNLNSAFDLSTGTYLKFGKLKLEKGSVATPWCLSQSELTTTTRDYRGVTLNDKGLTATAGSTTVAMNSNDGFLIYNLKDASADNPGGQVFHVDTDGNLNMKGAIMSEGTISGVNFTGKSLTLSGDLHINGGSILVDSGDKDNKDNSPLVVLNNNGLTLKNGGLSIIGKKDGKTITTTWIKDDGTFSTIQGDFAGRVSATSLTLTGENAYMDVGSGKFHVYSNGNVTANSISITGNRKADVSNLALIKGANITDGNIIKGNIITGNTITGGTINGSVFRTLNGQNKISNLSRPYFSDVGSKSFRISKSGLLTAENSVLKVLNNRSAYTLTIGDKKGTFSNYIGYSGSEKNLTTDFYRYGVGQQESPSSQGVVGYYYYGNDNVPDGRADPKGTVVLPVAWIKNNPGIGYMYLQYYLGVDASNVVNGNFRMVAFSPNYKNFSFSNDKTTGLDYLSSFNYDRFNFSDTDISGKYIRSNNFHIPTGMDTLYMDEFDLSTFSVGSDICFGIAIYPEQVADKTHPWGVAFTLESFSWGSESVGDVTLNVDESHGSNVSSQSLNISNNGALSIEYVGDSSGGTNVDYSYINMNKGMIDLTASQPGYGTRKTMKTTISGTGIDFNTFNVSDPNDVYPITFRGTVTNTGGQTGIRFDGYGNVHAQVGAGVWRVYNNQGDEVFNVPFDPNGVFNFYVPKVNKNTDPNHKWGGLKIGWVYFDQPQYRWAETVPAIYNTGGRVKGIAMFDQYLISFVDGWCYQLSSWWNHGVPNGVDSSKGEAQGTNTDAGYRGV